MPIIYKYIIKNNKKIIKYLFLLVILFLNLLNIVPKFLIINTTLYWFLYFVIGCIIKEEIEKIKNLKRITDKYNYLIMIICFIVMLIYSIFSEKVESNIITIIVSLIGCIFWYEITKIVIIKLKLKEYIKKCGSYSLQLYLLNGYFLVISRILIVSVCNVKVPAVIIIFNSLFDIILPVILIDKIIMKSKILMFFCGCSENKNLTNK